MRQRAGEQEEAHVSSECGASLCPCVDPALDTSRSESGWWCQSGLEMEVSVTREAGRRRVGLWSGQNPDSMVVLTQDRPVLGNVAEVPGSLERIL